MYYTDFRYQDLVVDDIKSTLQRVEINPTELCDKTCVFCPRSDPKIYKNRRLHLSFDTCTVIGRQLQAMNFQGTIGLVGFGEPLLHPNLAECVSILRQHSNQPIEINTNGTQLTTDLAKSLVDAGCTNITVSMYDQDQTQHFEQLCQGLDVKLTLRHHYQGENYNLNLVNRIAIVDKSQFVNPVNRPCYLPFYKLFIDWNGDYLLCNQDWARDTGGKYNVHTTDIEDFWLDKINAYRRPLAQGQRQQQSPCDRCDVNGVLHGQQCFDTITKHLF